MSRFDSSLLVKDGGWGKGTTAKECCQLLEAENSPQFPDSEETGSTGTKN